MEKLIDKKKLFDRYLDNTKIVLSSNVFINVFLWQDFYEFVFKEIDSTLCVFARNHDGIFQYLPPIGGKCTGQVLDKCFTYMNSINENPRFSRIENFSDFDLSKIKDDVKCYNVYKKYYEICYYRDDIVSLKGNAFKSRRSDYNYFVKNHNFEVRDYENSMFEEVINLFKSWQMQKISRSQSDISTQFLMENEKVLRQALNNICQLELFAKVVLVDGKISAISIGYYINKQIFCVLFEIINKIYKGIAAYIFREVCRDSKLAASKFINVMDNCDLYNLDEVKASYKPSLYFAAYNLEFR